ncbi:probable nucleoredoxin 1-2 [Chenopodium quinoa]|uniref:probable nucleoredoxin 1-2 n=1 Tax=Chenopodium quinoa TaxID=63459 RepID=UPI000B77C6BA|nr:probable nucleoredoxin 1-2 [Chenopodium quinoa]
MSLLSGLSYLDRNNLGNKVAVQEETFVGKYIMLCCVHVPIFLDSSDARWMQELVNMCFDLYATRNDFEMVVAVKMSSMADYEVVFDHFLSSLPSCLVIPYKESMHRDFICKYLDLVDSWYIKCLILDADVNRKVLVYGFPYSFVHRCGTDAFPFTKEKISEVIDKDKTSTLSLEGLLGCNSSYVLEDYNKKKITISELNKNVVAFYLCVDGSFASTLHDIHQQCIKTQLPFEIVMVYVPFITRLDPQVHKNKIDRLLKKGISMSWWRLPFNINVCQKFCRLMGSDRDDFKVMIVGPDNEYVDKYAGEILKECNVECYPFTREALLQKELKQLEELTLESLLVTGSTNYVYKGNTTFPLSRLQGKNVLVYYMSAEDHGPDYYHLVLKWYHEIKADVGDLEVVVVRLTNVPFENYDDLEVAETMEPLCVCPYDPEHSEILVKRIFFRYRAAPETLFKFGSDGKICSFRAHNHLYDCGSNSSKAFRELGGLHLRQDVITDLKESYSFTWDMN